MDSTWAHIRAAYGTNRNVDLLMALATPAERRARARRSFRPHAVRARARRAVEALPKPKAKRSGPRAEA